MNILALDLGTTTGWAIKTGLMVRSGSQSFKPQRFEGGGMRYLKFRRWLTDVLTLSPFQMVVFEEVRRHLGVDAAHAYGGFLSTLSAWCEENGIPYHGETVQEIKMSLGCKGNAKKEVVIAAVKKLGYSPADDNEADAIALLLLGLKKHDVAKPRVRMKR